MTQGLRTFLTFQGGVATAALDLYRDIFDDFELIEIALRPWDNGPEETIKVAQFRLAGSASRADSLSIMHGVYL
jgi:predicted 3-demethylubiquinone-9 3-methyltransferase (glyoxalase superfamily)